MFPLQIVFPHKFRVYNLYYFIKSLPDSVIKYAKISMFAVNSKTKKNLAYKCFNI